MGECLSCVDRVGKHFIRISPFTILIKLILIRLQTSWHHVKFSIKCTLKIHRSHFHIMEWHKNMTEYAFLCLLHFFTPVSVPLLIFQMPDVIPYSPATSCLSGQVCDLLTCSNYHPVTCLTSKQTAGGLVGRMWCQHLSTGDVRRQVCRQ